MTDNKVGNKHHTYWIIYINVCVCVAFQWHSRKESAYNEGDEETILGWRRCPGDGDGNPFHYSCLGNPIVSGPGELQSSVAELGTS